MKWILIIMILSVVGNGILFCIHKKSENDHSLTYMDATKISLDAVRFCEEKNLFEKKIFANFLMRTYLTNPYCGYLASEKSFPNVFYEFSDTIDYVVIESFERNDLFDSIRKNPTFRLVKRFDRGISWCEIYEKNL